ncbi:queuosine salvage family protein [Myxococcota bacterium]|nr:queuosine salvage family protein [Myxococcota bacterium]
MSSDVFDRIRSSCGHVALAAESVEILDAGLDALVGEFMASSREIVADPAQRPLANEAQTLAFVVTLNAINFGSGYFPDLNKRPGMSGYFTIATCLEELFQSQGGWSARELSALSPAVCARVFGQSPGSDGATELMGWFARALNDLGDFLLEGYQGRFEGPVEECRRSAAALVEILARMPLYGDVSQYGSIEVPFYKRAQLTASDLARAFEGKGFGAFDDLERLTLFADNLVPHVLRRSGVLRYSADLAGRIDREELLVAGSPPEVELRACAVHAVERLVDALARTGAQVSARDLDGWLWGRGQAPEIKATPRHRTRTSYY